MPVTCVLSTWVVGNVISEDDRCGAEALGLNGGWSFAERLLNGRTVAGLGAKLKALINI